MQRSKNIYELADTEKRNEINKFSDDDVTMSSPLNNYYSLIKSRNRVFKAPLPFNDMYRLGSTYI